MSDQQTDLSDDFRTVFETPVGQRVLDVLLDECYLDQSTIDPDPLRMAFSEGRRSVAILIQSHLALNPREFMKKRISRVFERIDAAASQQPETPPWTP